MNETPHPTPEQADGAAQPGPAQPGPAEAGQARPGPYQQQHNPYQRQAGQYPPGDGYQQPGAGAPPTRSGPLHSFFASVRRTGLFRSEERWVGGVAGGLARRLDIDSVLVRCVWLVLIAFSGIGLVLYGLAWALLPEERDGRIHVEQAACGDINTGLAGAVVAFITGFGLGEGGLFPAWFVLGWTSSSFGRLLATLFWVGLILLVLWAVTRGARTRQTPQPGATYQGRPHAGGAYPGGTYPGRTYPATPQPGATSQPTTAWVATAAAGTGRPAPTTGTGTAAPAGPEATTGSTDAAAAPRAATVSTADAGVAADATDPAVAEGPADAESPVDTAHPTTDTAAPVDPVAPTAAPAQPAPAASAQAFHAPYQPSPSPTPAWATSPAYRPGVPNGPQTAAPAWQTPVAVAPVRVVPHQPRVPGPGRSLSLTVLALILFSLAASGLATTTGHLGVLSALVVCAGLLVTALGLGVVISAFRGRRGGWMSVWGLLTLVIAVPSLVFGSVISGVDALNGRIPDREVNIVVTEAVLDGAGGHLDLGNYAVGTINIDLRDLPAEAARGAEIDVSVGVGSVRVRTQQGRAVAVNAEVGVGEITGNLAESWYSPDIVQSHRTYAPWAATYYVTGENLLDTYLQRGGLDITAYLASPAAQTGGTSDAVQIDVEVGAGVVRVDEQRDEITWVGWVYDDYWVVDSWQEPNGVIHGGSDLPVPGMTFPAVSSDDVWACTDEVAEQMAADGEFFDWPGSPDSLDQLPEDVRAEVDACVLEQIDVRTGHVPEEVEAVPYPATEAPTAPATDAATPQPTATPAPTSTP